MKKKKCVLAIWDNQKEDWADLMSFKWKETKKTDPKYWTVYIVPDWVRFCIRPCYLPRPLPKRRKG